MKISNIGKTPMTVATADNSSFMDKGQIKSNPVSPKQSSQNVGNENSILSSMKKDLFAKITAQKNKILHVSANDVNLAQINSPSGSQAPMENNYLMSSSGKHKTRVNEIDENWIDKLNEFSQDANLFNKTTGAVSGGWQNYGRPISQTKSKIYNNLKNGMGSSFSGKKA